MWFLRYVRAQTDRDAVSNTLHAYQGQSNEQLHYLRDASTGLMGFLLVAPVARRQRVLETISDDASLDCQLKIKVFSTIDKLLSIETYLLCQIPEQSDTLKICLRYYSPYKCLNS